MYSASSRRVAEDHVSPYIERAGGGVLHSHLYLVTSDYTLIIICEVPNVCIVYVLVQARMGSMQNSRMGARSSAACAAVTLDS